MEEERNDELNQNIENIDELNQNIENIEKNIENKENKNLKKENFKSFEDVMWHDSKARDRDFEGYFVGKDRNKKWANMVWHDSKARDRDFEKKVVNATKTTVKYFKDQKKFRADKVKYVERPHLRNADRIKKKMHLKTRKITYGTGPIGMFVLYLLDYIIDFIRYLGENFLQFFSMGFELVYDFFFIGFRGIFPGADDITFNEYEGYRRVSKFAGTCISYKFIRYLLTIVSPPVGVFMGKGLRGFMTIIICTVLTYINFLLGVIYALVVTNRSRYADYYEKKEAQIYKKIEDQQNKDNKKMIFGETLGVISIIIGFIALIYFMVRIS